MTTRTIHHNAVTWVDLAHPTGDDVDRLRARFPTFHPLNFEDIRSPIERPKLDRADDYLFVVLHFPLWDSNEKISRASEVNFFLGRDYVVTVHNETLKPLSGLVERCLASEHERQWLLGRGASRAFHTLIDLLVDYIFPILSKVDQRIHHIEDELFESNARRLIQEIARLRRDIISLRRIIRQQIPIVQQLEKLQHPLLRQEMDAYFGDIADHLAKQRDIIDENYEIINSFAETADTLASYRINEAMRVLTVISVIMLPLTLISSIYGMNIDLPFASRPDAFAIAAAIMTGIAILMLLYFRRRGWL